MKKVILLIGLLAMAVTSSFAGNDIKTNYRTCLALAYSPANNVYEDDNLRLEIYDETLWATNKTERTIFLDLSQGFLMHNGSSYPMLSSTHQDEKKASKVNITSIDQYISLPPAVGTKQNETFICKLPNGLYGKFTTTETPSGNFSEYEERLFTMMNELVNESLEGDPKGKQYLGTASRHLTEDESINNIGASIAYAFNKRAEEWTPVTISTWVSDVYFAPYYVEMPPEIKKNEKKGFGVKKTAAAKIHIKADYPFEFIQDKSPVIVFDWTGDYKKGEFVLDGTRVSKKKGMSFGKILGATLATIATGGATVGLFINDNEDTFYKSAVYFVGQNADWGKMSYMNNTDLSQFNNKR